MIVIDGLDEAGGDGRNGLVDMLARNGSRLPDWIGLVVTSRPERDMIGPFQECVSKRESGQVEVISDNARI